MSKIPSLFDFEEEEPLQEKNHQEQAPSKEGTAKDTPEQDKATEKATSDQEEDSSVPARPEPKAAAPLVSKPNLELPQEEEAHQEITIALPEAAAPEYDKPINAAPEKSVPETEAPEETRAPHQEKEEQAAPEEPAVQAATAHQEKDLPEWSLDKQYYTIGEVAKLFHANVSHIRFWTTEFRIKTRTTRKGDRLYTPAQIAELRLIHHLVKVKQHTIKGAKEALKSGSARLEKQLDLREELQKLHQSLSEVRAYLLGTVSA